MASWDVSVRHRREKVLYFIHWASPVVCSLLSTEVKDVAARNRMYQKADVSWWTSFDAKSDVCSSVSSAMINKNYIQTQLLQKGSNMTVNKI